MKVEFFHDVICSFCFPMSDRMHDIKEELPELDIVHRSFALGWEPADFEAMFGSREAVKPEVLNHWRHANENDPKHRFNIEGMAQTDFNFPTSKNALLAAKAAGMVGGQDMYWEAFDKLQEGLFVRNLDIEQPDVIRSLIKETTIDFAQWDQQFQSDETFEAVQQDFKLASDYNLQGVPALIINGQYLISGAQPKDVLLDHLNVLLEKEQPKSKLQELGNKAEACNFEDGQWQCD